MAKTIFRAATFRPAEIEKITGIRPDDLRNFRKRGYVEETEGWTAATLLQTARLIIVSRLSAIRFTPAASWQIARFEDAAEQIIAFALDFDGAVGRAAKIGLNLGNELPTAIGGMPQAAPQRPETPPDFPAVHDMPPPRTTKVMTEEEKKRAEAELALMREQQARRAQSAAANPN